MCVLSCSEAFHIRMLTLSSNGLQIESQEAVDNIVDIAAVDGVDCIQMGPLDLRSDMGLLRVPDDKRPSMLLRSVIHEIL
jgi:2-keto-3-deoxy-L-rhamnonate aldolase RhmA